MKCLSLILAVTILTGVACFGANKPGFDCPTALARAYYTTRFDDEKAIALKKLRERDPQVVDVALEPEKAADRGAYPFEYHIYVVYKNGTRSHAGYFKFAANNGGMSSTERVEPKYSDTGLNRLGFLHALTKFPDTNICSDAFMETNQAAFLTSLATGKVGKENIADTKRFRNEADYSVSVRRQLAEELNALTSGDSALAFRERALAAYTNGSPYGRNRANVGFENIGSIVLTRQRGDKLTIQALVKRGPTDPNDPPDVFIVGVDSSVSEITPEGNLVKHDALPPSGAPALTLPPPRLGPHPLGP